MVARPYLQRYCVLVMSVVLLGLGTEAGGQQGFPSRLEQYLKTAGGLSRDERARLLAGQPITKLLASEASKGVGVLGAVWINAPIRRYVDSVKNIETLEAGGAFKVTRRVSQPPRLADFDALRLPNEDFAGLRSCRVGKCAMKLSAEAIQRFRSDVNWSGPNARQDADALMRRLALDYVTRYLQGGNDQLAVYRDKSRPVNVTQEFRAMVDRMPELSAHMPNLRRYLLEFPAVTLPDSTSFLYWQETQFGLKPTIRLSHLTIREGPEDTVVASKMLYASHYFWTGLEIRALVPDPARGAGFWFVTVNRCRADGLSGLTGVFVRPRVRSEVQSGALAALNTTKQKLER